MEILGIIAIPLLLAFVGIYLTNRSTNKAGERTAKAITTSTAELIQAARVNGVNCIEKAIAAEATASRQDTEEMIKAIQANGEQTLKAISANGKATRETLVALKTIVAEE